MFVNIYADNRPENIKSIIIWCAALLFLGYLIVNVFVPNGEMIVYARILDVSATAVALYIFAKDAWIGVFRPVPRPRDFLIVGIWIKFFSAWALGLYAIVYRLAGEPPWLFNNELLSPLILLSVVAVVLHVCTPGTVEGVVPRRNQYALAVGIGAAVLIACLLTANKPNIGAFIEPLRPWISDWWETGRPPKR